jgi:hypothetical protein
LNLFSKLTIFEALRAIASLSARGAITRAHGREASAKVQSDRARLSARSIDGLLESPTLARYLALLERHWHLGTNDVLHLTAAAAWRTELRQPVTMVTRDLQLAVAARKERLAVLVPAAA